MNIHVRQTCSLHNVLWNVKDILPQTKRAMTVCILNSKFLVVIFVQPTMSQSQLVLSLPLSPTSSSNAFVIMAIYLLFCNNDINWWLFLYLFHMIWYHYINIITIIINIIIIFIIISYGRILWINGSSIKYVYFISYRNNKIIDLYCCCLNRFLNIKLVFVVYFQLLIMNEIKY